MFEVKSFLDILAKLSNYFYIPQKKLTGKSPSTETFNGQKTWYKKKSNNGEYDKRYFNYLKDNLEWFEALKGVRDLITHTTMPSPTFHLENNNVIISFSLQDKIEYFKDNELKKEIKLNNTYYYYEVKLREQLQKHIKVEDMNKLCNLIMKGFDDFLVFYAGHFCDKFKEDFVTVQEQIEEYEIILNKDEKELDFYEIRDIREKIDNQRVKLSLEDTKKLFELDNKAKNFLEEHKEEIKRSYINFPLDRREYFLEVARQTPPERWWYRFYLEIL